MSSTAFLADVENFPEDRTRSATSDNLGDFLSWRPYISTTKSITQSQSEDHPVKKAD